MSAALKQFFALLILVMIGVVLFYAYKYVVPKPVLGCTLEAKICPDGSTVGRTGPHCEFAACPNGDALFEAEGTTTASSLDARGTLMFSYDEHGAARTVPLAFDERSECASGAASVACIALNVGYQRAFADKHVRVTGTYRGADLLVSRMESLSAATTTVAAPLPQTQAATVSIGQAVQEFGLSIMPLEVIDDSRCPRDVQCFAAGTVHLKLLVTSAAGTSELVIALGQALRTPEAFITLTGVFPEKISTEAIVPADYRFTLEVTKR
jgi:hypothetical protein